MHTKSNRGMLQGMEFLTVSHSYLLIAMSCIVAMVASFTGLSLTRNLSPKPVFEKKASVALGSVALGGGIWAMHFVAMLGLKLPVSFYYDAAITLVSALSAILIVGAALILLHFAKRTPIVILGAGAIVGVGVLVMHYIGMAGLELCRAVYSPFGVALSSIAAIGLCMMAFWIAYGRRTRRNILLGTICFAVAVVAVHFIAIAGTNFMADSATTDFGPTISHEALAIGVIIFSFVIFGACLWVSVTYLIPSELPPDSMPAAPPQPSSPVAQVATELQIPCDSEGRKVFVRAREVLFVRADGHYTQVYTDTERLFSVWPISEACKRLTQVGFIQTHRSYVVNPARVARFERDKDKGRCLFDGNAQPTAPVSRSKLKAIQDALDVRVGATRA